MVDVERLVLPKGKLRTDDGVRHSQEPAFQEAQSVKL